MKKILGLVILIAILGINTKTSYAHCEIPCGIYEDTLRVELIAEHITTIEKSMKQIIELSEANDVNYNQLVRWVTNKEEHAIKIQEIASQYFLHQRIKYKSPTEVEAYAKYTNQLVILHQIQVYAMKTKQSTDLENIKKLRELLHDFSHSYFHTHPHKH